MKSIVDINFFSFWGGWLSWLIVHVTLDLGVMISSPMLGVEVTLKKKKRQISLDLDRKSVV